MKALVLSGGGSKGSYQIGVWKALRKLNIKYDLVTGTSVGALNGALVVQNNYRKAMKLWKHMNMNLLFGENATNSEKTKDIINMYRINFFKNGGMDVKSLENLIDKSINKDKFYNSRINFGLVTINVNGKKALQLSKNKIPSNKLVDYLMASASCYPAFQAKDIDGKKFIDGGIFDNLPINLATFLGANEIIAVDLCAPGFKQIIKNKKKLNITTIKPNNKLTNFLNFNEVGSKRNIKFGYNDTMKVFEKFNGNKYTFKNKKFNELLDDYRRLYIHNFNRISSTEKLAKKFNLTEININNHVLNIIEELGTLFNFDETKIYNLIKYNKKLLKSAKRIDSDNIKMSKKQKTVINLFKDMKKNHHIKFKIKDIFTPKEFLMALYLYTLGEE